MADNRLINPGEPASQRGENWLPATIFAIRRYLGSQGFDLSTLSDTDILTRLEKNYATYKIGREQFREPLGKGQ